MQPRKLTAWDAGLLTSPRKTAQGVHRGSGDRLLRIAAAFIRRIFTATPQRTVANLGDRELRDIGQWRVDSPVPLGRAQRAFAVHEAWGRLRLF